MAFTKLTSDVAINQSMPDRPNADGGLTGTQMKEVLDRAAVIIKTYLNTTLVPELEADTGASNIGVPSLNDPDVSSDVATELAYLLDAMQDITQGAVSDGSITLAKLALGVRALVTREFQLVVKETAGTQTFTPSLDGNYFVLLVGAGSGTNGARGGSNNYQQSKAGYAGGVAVKICTLTADTEYTLTVGAGGTGGTTPTTGNGIEYGGDGGDTSFAVGGTTIFKATGGKNSSSTPGGGVDADIVFGASTPRTVSMSLSTNTDPNNMMYYPSDNILSQPIASTSDTGKWGATGVYRISRNYDNPIAGIDGGDGAAVIFYLG